MFDQNELLNVVASATNNSYEDVAQMDPKEVEAVLLAERPYYSDPDEDVQGAVLDVLERASELS